MILALLLATNLLMILAFASTPFVTRKTELFGVSLPSAEHGRPELRSMRRSYLIWSLILGGGLTGATAAAVLLTGDEIKMAVIYTALVFVYLVAGFVLYLIYHGRMKSFKAAQDWSGAETALVADMDPGKDTFSPVWLALYPMITLATILATYLIWPMVPDKIPMNYDMAGNPASWVDKSWRVALFMPLFQVFIFVVFGLVYFIVGKSKRQIDAAQPEKTRAQGRRFRRVMSGSTLFGGAFMGLYFGACQLMMLLAVDGMVAIWSGLGLLAVVFVLVVLLVAKVGQGGSRIRVDSSGGTAEGNVDDDKYWKLGLFYYNKDDPSVFVEKRFGIGFTNNWARPLTWLFVLGMLALIAGVLWATYYFTR